MKGNDGRGKDNLDPRPIEGPACWCDRWYRELLLAKIPISRNAEAIQKRGSGKWGMAREIGRAAQKHEIFYLPKILSVSALATHSF
jgi:hypothetical protein